MTLFFLRMASRVLLLCLCIIAAPTFAETIEFPEEEIATETVLPVFDRVEAVKNRNVELKNHVEVGAGVGLMLNEPYYNPMNFGANVTYHLTETHAINLVGQFFLDGLSSYGSDLQAGKGLTNDSFDPGLAPHPTYMMLANYQFTAYYGKISVSKQTVMNLSLFGVVGLGYIGMKGAGAPALNIGFGQNFYFTKRVALRLDLRMDIYQAADPTTVALPRGSAAPPASSFGKTTYFNSMLTAGVVFVL